MVQRTRTIEYEDEAPGSAALARVVVWAGLAAIALGSAALAAQTRTGAERLAAIIGNGAAASGRSSRAAVTPRPSAVELESRRLAEAVHVLAADRDRLLARVDALERNQEVTGSIPPPVATPPPSAALAPTWARVPSSIPPAAGIPPTDGGGAGMPSGAVGATTINPAAPLEPEARAAGGLVANEQAAASVATKTEFAVDIGGEKSFDGLRALWTALKTSHGALFEGLRPVAGVREGAKPGTLELRLVVGPLANAVAAARLCATLGAAGLSCQPTVFDGQRFALR